MGYTHLAIGLLAALVFLSLSSIGSPLVFVFLVCIGGLLPDIDHQGSWINKILPVTRWFARFFTHRGFFHSVFPVVLIYFVFWLFRFSFVGFGLAFGYLVHLVSDSMTKLGVNFLHPIGQLHVRGFVTVGGIWEVLIFVLVLVVDGIWMWRMVF